jgi:hypothetical protein
LDDRSIEALLLSLGRLPLHEDRTPGGAAESSRRGVIAVAPGEKADAPRAQERSAGTAITFTTSRSADH